MHIAFQLLLHEVYNFQLSYFGFHVLFCNFRATVLCLTDNICLIYCVWCRVYLFASWNLQFHFTLPLTLLSHLPLTLSKLTLPISCCHSFAAAPFLSPSVIFIMIKWQRNLSLTEKMPPLLATNPPTYILTWPHPFWGQKGKADWSVKGHGGLKEGDGAGRQSQWCYTNPMKRLEKTEEE